ncbi:phosphodiester glycosidase family protein [Streptomyces alboniger]|uniref:Phosphodiester glycosidase family protein n=1 Tax=Streptomyces alboniger TaxID=132473 RepID=A0A5J6HEL8_STRAD|nr:phosphodiester glycosidase family protein [Streptomyces alboniger]QEV16724.1 phosphodiester glycosidase family protein [Streptomyces alboniger]
MTRQTQHGGRFRAALALVSTLGALAGAALTGAAPASGAVEKERQPAATRIAPGVEYRSFDIPASRGTARAHVLDVDLRDPRTRVGLLYPGKVAARSPVSALADGAGAVGGINGDFFNITETQHPGVEATGAPVGPMIANGRALKAAVPDGQRFGPAMPPGVTTRAVLGVGTDRRARLGDLALDGEVRTRGSRLPLGGLNQYALPVGSVGAFTSDWGAVSRVRATCGTDTSRGAPCSTDTHEVTVRHGRVVASADTPGTGPIAPGSTVLVGREAGAQELRKLSEGDRVGVRHRLVAADSRVPFRFALGGYPVLRGGAPLPGLDTTASAVRTAAGISDGGRRLVLLSLDGSPEFRTGLTIAEVARTLRELGASDGFSLDGGGSSTLVSATSTLVARAPGADAVTVRNNPSGGVERPVPNGIGVFSGK